MRSRFHTPRSVAFVLGLFVAAGANAQEAPPQPAAPQVFAADKGPDKIDVSSFPEEMQRSYELFAVKCKLCHTLARPINTDFPARDWMLYTKKMMSKAEGWISPADGKTIYKFLEFYQAKKDQAKKDRGPGKSGS